MFKFLLFLALLFLFTQTNAEKNLVLFQLFTRHGARTPIHKLPNDDAVWYCENMMDEAPSFDQSSTEHLPFIFRRVFIMDSGEYLGNCTHGQLTKTGSEQHRSLGKKLRAKLIDTGFLDKTYNPDEVYIRSTDVDRTRQSAQSLFLGLFDLPVDSFSRQDSHISKIVPIHTLEKSNEYLNTNGNACPLVEWLQYIMKYDQEYLQHEASLADLKAQMKKIFKTDDIPALDDIADTIECRIAHGVSLPDGMTQEHVKQLEDEMFWQFNFTYTYKNLSRYALGLGLRDVLQEMILKINGLTTIKFKHYSAHDTTVAPLMYIFGVQTGQPTYAAHIYFQLYKEAGKYFVKLEYQDQPIIIPGCKDVYCPFQKFYQIAMDLIPQPYYKACRNF
ncbi:lysophosphatidic acid phosphatase type 6 [Anaeramoeba flamelloides]|uniref:Lysophosphatidic acid phosphatase type n=1 Tax=Anaeramoeba flamelloides TaxID=1746091 RepID=A0AAV7YTK5_9EUKA|nr:lysophosphatidic acid phosphatase type [Anaeramoeba flamelloides]KAJ6246950.1 lysophosphatidic acid phosphatase type 6 [Anaeramoeba flamelloides]